MRLYKRGKYWWASWTEGGVTVKRTTRSETKDAALACARRWERERADPAHYAAHETTLRDEADRFLRQCKTDNLAAGTLNMYECKVRHVLSLMGERTTLDRVDAEMVGNYIRVRREEGASDSTVYKEWIALRGILSGAWRRGAYPRDPRSLKPRRFTNDYKPRTRFLSPEEVVGLLEALPEHRRAPVAFAMSTGARRLEVFRARREDVDLIHWRVALRGSKTRAARREIPIPAPFRELLRHALDVWAPPRIGTMFPSWSNARRDILLACKTAGIEPATWNDLRRTFASLLVQRGAAPHVVAKLLGHTTTAMVDKVYGQQTATSLAGLLEAQVGDATSVPAVSQAPRLLPESVDLDNAEASEETLAAGDAEDPTRIKSPQLYRLSYQPDTQESSDVEPDASSETEPPEGYTVPRVAQCGGGTATGAGCPPPWPWSPGRELRVIAGKVWQVAS